MDIELARHVTRKVFMATRELGDLVPFLNERLREDEYQDYARALALSIHAVQSNVLDKLFADHAGLEAEVGASIEKYDRYL